MPLGVPLAVTLFGDVWRDAGHAAAAMCMYTLGDGVISVVGEALKAAGDAAADDADLHRVSAASRSP